MTQLEVRPVELDPVLVAEPQSEPARRSRPELPRIGGLVEGVALGLFWGWNVVFLAFVLLGFVPMVLPNLVSSTWRGVTPPIFLAYAALLVVIPVVTVIVAWTRIRNDAARLFALGYGVEGPALILASIALFGMRELNAAAALLFGVAALGLSALLWTVLDRRFDDRWMPVHAAALAVMAIVGIYATVFVAFYALPLAAQFLRIVGDAFGQLGQLASRPPDFWTNPERLLSVPFIVLGVVLLTFSATLFVVMPLVLPYIYVGTWWHHVRRMTRPIGAVMQGLVVAALVMVFALLMRQPQTEAFALLSTPPTTAADAQALREREALLRDGLRNAYLAPMRYVSSVGEVSHISELYRQAFGLEWSAARAVQDAYEWLVRPLLYVPVEPAPIPAGAPGSRVGSGAFTTEPARAAALYREMFDEPILDGEREAIVNAVRSTWDTRIAADSRREVEDREIKLLRQELSVVEHGDWADLELYEVYQNETRERQEVIYYFSLPETAVVTGVWLGESSDRDRRYQYQLSPRGAAQQMYRTEVRRQIDPALVEQVGPLQYRLRVFPIEPARFNQDSETAAPAVHMWLTWRALRSADGAWPLPRLAEKRNVFFDSSTARSGIEASTADAWLPPSVPARTMTAPQPRQVTFASGETVVVRPAPGGASTAVATNLRMAVVLDRSRSMARHAVEVRETLQRLRSVGADTDVYLTTSTFRGEPASRVRLADLDLENLEFVSGQQASDLLVQFDALRADTRYDVAMVMTDGTGFDLAAAPVRLSTFDFPIWMLHLGGAFSLGYDDGTLAAIQTSGGGVAGTLDALLTRLRDPRIVDGYAWSTTPASDAVPVAASDPFAAFAARQLILDHLQRQRGAASDTATLDRLHTIARTHSIVTPYSSMIVLVNSEQQRRLAELERQGDRFEREGEGVGETVPGALTNVTAVPEPHEWLLMGLGLLILGWWLKRTDRLQLRALPWGRTL